MNVPDKERSYKTWRTIDYIGGGFVLQVRVNATVVKSYRHNHRKNAKDFQSATVSEVESSFEVDVDKRESRHGDSANIESVHQPHRVVHLSELNGVDMGELVNKIEERGELK